MAQDIQINLKLEAADSAKTIGDIRKQIKALNNEALAIGEGGAGFSSLTKKAAELKDKLDDLNDSTSSLKGSGVEKLTASMGLLKEGFTNADPGKLGTGMKVLGAAMKAIPIFLIIEGIKFLVENFDKLKASSGLLGKAFRFIGDVIESVVQGLKDFADWIGITNFAAEKSAQSQIDNYKKVKDASINRYDSEIAAAKRAGTDTALIEVAKAAAIQKSNDIQIAGILKLKQLNGSLTEDQLKQLAELRKNNQEQYKAQLDGFDSYNDAKKKKEEEAAKTAKENREKRISEEEKEQKAYDDFNIQAKKDVQEADQKLRDAQAKKLRDDKIQARIDGNADAEQMLSDEEQRLVDVAQLKVIQNENDLVAQQEYADAKLAQDLANEKLTAEQKAIIYQNYLDDKKAREKTNAEEGRDNTLAIAKVSNDGLMALSDLYFTVKRANLKKGSAEDLAAAKKQFEINKKLSLVSATIMGVQSVISAFNAGASTGPAGVVLGPAMAILAGISAAANIAKISASKFDGGAASPTAAATPGVPSVETATAAAAPRLNDFSLFGTAGSKNNLGTNGSGQNAPIKAYVSETEVTQTQKKVSNFKTAAEL